MSNMNNDLKSRVFGLDIDSVKLRLVQDEGWSKEKADAVEPAYKGYLYLTAHNHNHPLVPSKDVDKMWHTHILDTRKYASDCQSLFGTFIHHIPATGNVSAEDKVGMTKAFNATDKLLREVVGFGFDGAGTPALCQADPECSANASVARPAAAAICQGKQDNGECFAGVSDRRPAAQMAICQGKQDGGECFAGVSTRPVKRPAFAAA